MVSSTIHPLNNQDLVTNFWSTSQSRSDDLNLFLRKILKHLNRSLKLILQLILMNFRGNNLAGLPTFELSKSTKLNVYKHSRLTSGEIYGKIHSILGMGCEKCVASG